MTSDRDNPKGDFMFGGLRTKCSLRTFFSLTIYVAALGLISYQQFLLVKNEIQLAFAKDQMEIFSQMVEESRCGTPKGNRRRIAYIHAYYPSGSKQTADSDLDFLVETWRQHCIEEVEFINSAGNKGKTKVTGTANETNTLKTEAKPPGGAKQRCPGP